MSPDRSDARAQRRAEVARLTSLGWSAQEIAGHLHITTRTVHRDRVAVSVDSSEYRDLRVARARPECGSHNGYQSHLRHGETPCRVCTDANNEYYRSRARRERVRPYVPRAAERSEPRTREVEWRRLVLDEGWTFRDVGAYARVDEATVRAVVGSAGRPPGVRPIDIPVERAVKAYNETGSEQAAADYLGVSRSVIRRRLHLAGIRAKDFHDR